MTNSKIQLCPVCGGQIHWLVKLINKRSVYSCNQCGLRQLLPLPSSKFLTSLYGREKYYTRDLAELHNSLADDYNPQSPIIQLYKRHLQAIISNAPPPGRLLEIGCARGVFLDLARRAGYKVYGIEMNPYAANYARKHFGLSIVATKFENARCKIGSFDIIVAFDVLEHVPDPDKFLRRVASLLKPKGLIVIGTPNSSSFLYILAENLARWSGGRIGYPLFRFYGRGIEHLSIFSEKNLELATKKNSLTNIYTYGYSIPFSNLTDLSGIYRLALFLLAKFPYEFILLGRKNI